MASPAPQIQSRHLDNQGFLIGEHRLRDMAKGIDRIADNSAEILTILKQLRDQQNQTNPSASPPPTSQQRTGNGRVLRILPDLPPTIHSNDARQGRQSSNAGSRGASNPPDPIPNAQLDRNQSARRNGIYNGDTVNSNEIRDRQRDTRGRFTGGNQRGDAGGDQDSIPSRVAEAVKDGMLESAKVAAPKGVDPTLDALHEMGSALEPIKGLFGRREKIPKEQARHNKIELKWLRRIAEQRQNAGAGGGSLLGAGLLRMLPMILSGLGGLVAAVVSGLTAAAPLIAAALAAALVAWLAKKAWDKAGEIADEKRAPEQGDVNPDGSSNKGVIGLLNRGAKGIMNGVRGGLNSANEALGGDGDYWDDGTAPDSKNRVGLKTDAVNGGKVASGKYAPLLDEIASGEANGGAFGTSGYDAVYSGAKSKPSKPISQMTVGEVKAYQQQLIKAGSASTAVGRYQFISNKGAFGKMAAQAGLKDTDIFDSATQDKLAIHYAGGEDQLDQWIKSGNYSALTNKVAQQWASQKNSKGVGNYDGDGLNKARHGGVDVMRKIGEKIKTDQSNSNTTQKKPTSDSSTPPLLAKPAPNTSVITKAATDISANMNGVLSGKASPNLFAPAQGVAGISQPVLPPTAQPMKLPDVPPTREKLSSDAPQQVHVTNANDSIGQNVGDRDLAHAITGGLGMRK